MSLKKIACVLCMLIGIGQLHAQNKNEAVGTPQGNLSVSESGAAVYSVSIEAPNGGPLTPQIGLAYNSQMNGYGLAGYGVNLTGLSVITRGGKDMFHDKELKGVTYTESDNFYLDGKRLILKSGSYGNNNSTYSVEGDPFTRVILHSSKHQEQYEVVPGYWTVCQNHEEDEEYIRPVIGNKEVYDEFWFEVETQDGLVLQYGKTKDSQLHFQKDSETDVFASWYINRTQDKYSNYVTYHYKTSDYYVRPDYIEYGKNSKYSRGIVNRIEFEYKSLGSNFRPFALANKQGKIGYCLSAITTSTTKSSVKNIYRKYTFLYDDNSDTSYRKWSRLVKIEEENGLGEKLAPLSFHWQNLSSCAITSSISSKVPSPGAGDQLIDPNNYFFSAIDINGDGVTDLIRQEGGGFINQSRNALGGLYTRKNVDDDCSTYYVSRSRISKEGKISFETSSVSFAPTRGISQTRNCSNGCSIADINGDGIADILRFHCEEFTKRAGLRNSVDVNFPRMYVSCIYGSDNNEKKLTVEPYFNYDLWTSDFSPMYVSMDLDGDGCDEILLIEREKIKNDVYPCHIISRNATTSQIDTVSFTCSFQYQPQKLFIGDYNNDGLVDMFVVDDKGYTILYNNGCRKGSLNGVFSNSSSMRSTTFSNHPRIEQGDFDGDGNIDFVFTKVKDMHLYLAKNNGDGTFTTKTIADIEECDQDYTDKEDVRFALRVFDADHDGLSDIFVCKADYHSNEKFTHTRALLFMSDGNSFHTLYNNQGKTENDALESSIFLGDFDGDGYVELANYGSNLFSKNNTVDGNINVYTGTGIIDGVGKISFFIDGFGNRTDIRYSAATNPEVYNKTGLGSYPVNNYTLPVSVVASVTSDNGALARQTTKYQYEDLKIHVGGGGMLGFAKIKKTNALLGITESTEITEWDKTRWLPTKVKATSQNNGKTATSATEYKIANVNGTYFMYESKKTTTDLFGNETTAETQYFESLGVIKESKVYNDGNKDKMYKKVVYDGYAKKGGVYVPATMVMEQQHADAPKPFSQKTTYVYDDNGDVVTIIENAGTDMALTSNMTYDKWGNIATASTSGKGVVTVLKRYTYDATGRYLTKDYTEPASTVTTYTYDLWGNILTETDATNSANKHTITHKYDGWGREVELVDAAGVKTIKTICWGQSDSEKYYVLEKTDNKPYVSTYYDKSGREMKQTSVGPKGILISKQTIYTSKGEVASTVSTTGDLVITQSFIYDALGRVTRESTSGGQLNGKTVTYSYGNRAVTTTIGSKNYTQTTDAWGNVVKSTDPTGASVTYKYHSCGKPHSISAHGSTVLMNYDAAGNQTKLTDPDAGTMTYTYAADGTLLSQTDGREITTTMSFDNLGRVATSTTGQKVTTYKYGTSGTGNMRLVSQTMDGNTITFTYDSIGHVISEKRTIAGQGTLEFKYAYNKQNQLEKTIYPGGVEESYVYDANGYKTKTVAGGKVIYELTGYTGKERTSKFAGKLTSKSQRNALGYLEKLTVAQGTTLKEQYKMSYDVLTDNLISRQRNGNSVESFGYDDMDRLVSVKVGGVETMQMSYAANGNILSKTGVGNYVYDTKKPHAVKKIVKLPEPLPNSLLQTTFNAFGKIEHITDDSNHLDMKVTYGPDQERWLSLLTDDSTGKTVRKTIYAGNYEKVTENGATREFYYLDGNTILVKQGTTLTPYLAFKDNLGSFLSIMDENGSKVFNAEYDAWGKQNVTHNGICFHRGYTGHEMWNEFGIINMNGRLYDPALGRFFSPDPFVQAPTNSQNFNRYSYCLNNPLKYNDPSGKAWHILAGAIIGSVMGTITSTLQSINNHESFGKTLWKGLVAGHVGGAIGAASAATGGAVSGWLGSTGALAGFASGAASGAVGGFLGGSSNAWMNGSSFKQGLYAGMINGTYGAAIGSFTGCVSCGADAYNNGRNFWTGQSSPNPISQHSPSGVGCDYPNLSISIDDPCVVLPEVIVGRYNNHSYAHAAMQIYNYISQTNNKLISVNHLFSYCYKHYQMGGGKPIFVDMSSSRINQLFRVEDINKGEIQTFSFKPKNLFSDEGLTLGRISVEKVDEEYYRVLGPDVYDFDYQPDAPLTRNVGTAIGGYLHDTPISKLFGGPFEIHFVGLFPLF